MTGKESRMIECDGYRMFRGAATVTPVPESGAEPFRVEGDWLCKPDSPGIWYLQPADGGFSRSFCEDILSDFAEYAG